MLAVILTLISIIIIPVFGYNESQINYCANYRNLCNPDYLQSCCDRTLKCKLTQPEGLYRCVKEAQLGESCEDSNECNTILWYARCSSEKKCTCSFDYVQRGARCEALLGSYCLYSEQCSPEHSVCVNSECKCQDLYSPVAHNLCLRTALGSSCSNSADCQEIRNADCSENVCSCRWNTIKVNSTFCASRLDELCATDGDCAPKNSICINNRCTCKLDFLRKNGHYCDPPHLTMPCRINADCNDFIKNSMCSEKKECQCLKDYVSTNETVCVEPYGAYCSSDEQCLLENSYCIGNACQCKPDYIRQGLKCESKSLSDFCENDADCDTIRFSKCSIDKKCACKDDYYKLNEKNCAPLLGGFCSRNENCIVENSICFNEKCQCKSGYKSESNNRCIPVYPVSACYDDLKCKNKYLTKCLEKRNVFRQTTSNSNRNGCEFKLGDSCWLNEQCTPNYSLCIENVCQCKPKYKRSESNDECISIYSDKLCYRNEDCNQIQHAICSEDNVCVCISKYDRINATACGPLLKEYCDISRDCATDNSICSGAECTCDDFFSRESNTRCLANFLGLSCKINEDCKNIKYAKCSRDNRCVCHSNYIRVDKSTCAPYIGEYCEHDSECFVNGTLCIRNTCAHDPSSNSKDNQKYSSPLLNEPCKYNADCNGIANAVCSENKECVCKPYYSQYNRTRCTSLSREFCSTNKDCLVENSACIDNFCQCKPNFIKASNHLCIFQSTEKFCLTDHDCTDLIHTYCSKNRKCVCESNYFSFGSTCLLNLKRGCDIDSDCFDENSVCYMNNCLCKPTYLVKSYRCEHVSLGGPCIQNSDCNPIPNAICSKDQKCVCNMQSYALNTVACAPMIGASCSFGNECYFENSECFSNSSCQCLANFTPVSETQCFPKLSLSICEVDLDCGEPWHHVCSEDNRCVCKQNNIAINRSTCLPILGGICWRDDQCMTENSACIDFQCKCKPNYITVPNNLCVESV